MKLPVRLDDRFVRDANDVPRLIEVQNERLECILTEFETTKTIAAIDAALAKAKGEQS